MGIKHATLAEQLAGDIELIQESASDQLQDVEFDTFRVSTKRQYKEFPLSSQAVNEEVGKHIQSLYLKPVDLKNAELDMIIELVKGMAYVGYKRIHGYGGFRRGPAPPPADVWLMEYDRRHQVAIRRGENRGRTISYHNVVRGLTKLGLWDGSATELKSDIVASRAGGRDGCVVIVQEAEGGPILGAVKLEFGG